MRAAALPPGLATVDGVKRLVRARGITYAVKDEELRLGREIGCIGDARAFEIVLCLQGDIARIAAICLECEWIIDVTTQDQSGDFCRRIDECSVRVSLEQHI